MILITGGARSGKSILAEKMARENAKKVLYIATAVVTDDEMLSRVEKHKKLRPPNWDTYEGYKNLSDIILSKGNNYDYLILECITTLITNYLFEMSTDDFKTMDEEKIEITVTNEIQKIINASNLVSSKLVVVTNEVGLGIVPENSISRFFRDLQGRVNQILAHSAEEVYLAVSGLKLKIK